MSEQVLAPDRHQRLGFHKYLKRSDEIEHLIDELKALEWTEGSRRASLQALFDASNTWALEQVRYYHGKRARRMVASNVFRGTALVFATVGVIIPLLEQNSGNLGYVFLAIAGAALAANSVFGGTTGHVRTVLAPGA